MAPARTPGTRRRARPLGWDLVDAFTARIAEGQLLPGSKLPTEGEIRLAFGVSRTVVREALSKLQAAGLVRTQHGVGTFVANRLADPRSLSWAGAGVAATLAEVVSILELRLALESEAAALAAARRPDAELAVMQQSLGELARAIDCGGDTVGPDRRLHQAIVAATGNAHFVHLLGTLSDDMIPRAKLDTPGMTGESRPDYLWRVQAEHDSIVSAIANRDPEAARAAMRTHLANSRERLRRAQAHCGRAPYRG